MFVLTESDALILILSAAQQTPAGLRLLADLRRSLHDPPAQLPQRNSEVHNETGVAPTDSVAIA